MAVTVTAAQRTLDSRRIMTDAPLASAHGYDISSKQNYQHERLFDEVAPGGGVQAISGHVHDDSGGGRGILRCTNGSFSLTGDTYGAGPPITLTVADGNVNSMANVDPAAYEIKPGLTYVMGICYISNGLGIDVAGAGNSFRVDVQAKASNTTDDPEIAIYNITDSVFSNWTNLTTAAAWYTIDVYSAVQAPPALTRTELEIVVRLNAWSSTSADFTVYAATPYEYKDAP